jgi:hypothetical protein
MFEDETIVLCTENKKYRNAQILCLLRSYDLLRNAWRDTLAHPHRVVSSSSGYRILV